MAAEPLPIVLDVLLPGERCLDSAMDEQVGITPDGRSEVHVGFEGKAEMADIARAVHRLLERAQQDGLKQREVRALADALDQLGIVLGSRHLAARKLQTQLGEKLAQR